MAQTIMTVDDSASVRQMLCFSLRQANYDVAEAENGVDALKKLNGIHPDIVITDLDMPQMHGIDLTKNIRKIPQYKYIPIIIVTTESDVKVKRKAKNAGATGWITKPFTPRQLVSIVHKLIGTKN